jgi:hypothetical protein
MKTCLEHGCPAPGLGSRRAHCSGCHNSFSGLSAFDRHQTLDGGSHCHDPAARGLVQRPDGVWRLPGDMPSGVFPPSGDDGDGRTGADAATDAHGEAGEAQEAGE